MARDSVTANLLIVEAVTGMKCAHAALIFLVVGRKGNEFVNNAIAESAKALVFGNLKLHGKVDLRFSWIFFKRKFRLIEILKAKLL